MLNEQRFVEAEERHFMEAVIHLLEEQRAASEACNMLELEAVQTAFTGLTASAGNQFAARLALEATAWATRLRTVIDDLVSRRDSLPKQAFVWEES